MEAALLDLLEGHAPLTALVPLTSMIWNHLPQGAPRPAIVLYRIAGVPGLVMQGSDGLTGALVQVDVQALTVTSMWAIRDVVLALLHGHRDATFQGIVAQGQRQDRDELTGTLIHRASLDFEIWSRL